MNRILVAGLVAFSTFFGVHLAPAAPNPSAAKDQARLVQHEAEPILVSADQPLVAEASASRTEPMDVRTVAMPFSECLSIIGEVSKGIGIKPVHLVRTEDLRVVRVAASDGFVTVSCSRPESRMTLSKRQAPNSPS